MFFVQILCFFSCCVCAVDVPVLEHSPMKRAKRLFLRNPSNPLLGVYVYRPESYERDYRWIPFCVIKKLPDVEGKHLEYWDHITIEMTGAFLYNVCSQKDSCQRFCEKGSGMPFKSIDFIRGEYYRNGMCRDVIRVYCPANSDDVSFMDLVWGVENFCELSLGFRYKREDQTLGFIAFRQWVIQDKLFDNTQKCRAPGAWSGALRLCTYLLPLGSLPRDAQKLMHGAEAFCEEKSVISRAFLHKERENMLPHVAFVFENEWAVWGPFSLFEDFNSY